MSFLFTATIITTGALALALPWLGMRLLWPALARDGHRVTNYRGQPVTLGLGLVWVVWAAGVASAVLLQKVMAHHIGEALTPTELETLIGQGSWAAASQVSAVYFLAVPMVVWALLFGLIDDVWGGASDKGFKGHLSSLARGRVSTGALKVLGIGLASLGAAWLIVVGRQSGSSTLTTGQRFWTWALAAAVIALSANLVNLFDLRPGRALKFYGAFSLAAITALATVSTVRGASATSVAVWAWLWMIGPVLAVWGYDLSEQGMLGDAGANAAGALAGFILAYSLQLGGLAAATAVLLGMNVLSEKVSYSRLIESNAALSWLDGLGRPGEHRKENG